ncbi:uncharacterized protein [Amphiura filiformis]|uniref:uncharacterized protein isoform X2 n=1 Tax=Amphiura filiformis TaxID=82378 RepID=UPI003B2217EC
MPWVEQFHIDVPLAKMFSSRTRQNGASSPNNKDNNQRRSPSHQDKTPLWFHGLLVRNVAEDLLLKGPQAKEGLFLVRQSSNRGGCFVISVSTGKHVNHYLIETVESMFYVRRDRSAERGRDIQARDLCSLIHCYRQAPLDESGLTLQEPLLRKTPVKATAPLTAVTKSKVNHNYIPLHIDDREYIAMEDFVAKDDLQAVSFHKGDILTVLQKESKNWWYAYNNRQELGYIPAALVCNLKDWHKHSGAFWNPVCPDFDDVFVESREDELSQQQSSWNERRVNNQSDSCKDFTDGDRDLNSNLTNSITCNAKELGRKADSSLDELSQDTIYVPTEYIASYLRHKEHMRLQLMQRILDERVHNRKPRQRHVSQVDEDDDEEEEEEQTHYEFPPDCRRDLKPKYYQNASSVSSELPKARTLDKYENVKLQNMKTPPRRHRTVPSNLGSKLTNKQPKPSVDFTHIHGDYDPMATYLRLSESTTGPPPVPPH